MIDGEMSIDEKRSLPASSRPVRRAELPPGPPLGLRDAIYAFYVEAGCPRLDALARFIAEDDSLPGAPKKDTIGKVISGELLALREDCVAVTIALARQAGRDDMDAVAVEIRQLWAAARVGSPSAALPQEEDRLGRPVDDCDPITLEVHRAIDAPDGHTLPLLPPYLPRAHDRRLRELADQILAGSSAMVTLVGASMTGKTRACWEMVKYLDGRMPGLWRVWHPIDPEKSDVDLVDAYTVVWLNNAQSYLAPPDQRVGERLAAGLRTLLAEPRRAPILVVATLWPRYWTTLTHRPDAGADLHAQARELLNGTDIDVPGSFSVAELSDLEDLGDPRLDQAGSRASAARVTQYLAGAPLLVDRYRKAEPAARAVLDAAIDARRLGHPPDIPASLLRQAAPGYLDDDLWDLLGDTWFEEAIAYCGLPCNGARGPLTSVRLRPGETETGQAMFRLADYLEQNGSVARAGLYPPTGFWSAASVAIDDAATARTLGGAAESRGRYQHARMLYRAAAQSGDAEAMLSLARLLAQAGDHDRASELDERAATSGHPGSANHLVFQRQRARGPADAAVPGQRAGHRDALQALSGPSRPPIDPGANPKGRSLPLLRPDPTRTMNHAAPVYVEDQGNTKDRRRQWQAHRRRAVGLIALARQLDEAGDTCGAEAAAHQAADLGYTGAFVQLAFQREQAGQVDAAIHLAREAAARGNPLALITLGKRRERADDLNGATALYREAANRGHLNALVHLAQIRELAGDPRGARIVRYLGLTDDGSPVEP
jgi:TPR repeat protein